VPTAILSGIAWRWDGTIVTSESIDAVAYTTVCLVEIICRAVVAAILLRITRWRHCALDAISSVLV
jgi:hypothetical protein